MINADVDTISALFDESDVVGSLFARVVGVGKTVGTISAFEIWVSSILSMVEGFINVSGVI